MTSVWYSEASYVDLPLLRACLAATSAHLTASTFPKVESLAAFRESMCHVQDFCRTTLAEAKLTLPLWENTGEFVRQLKTGDLVCYCCGVRSRGVWYFDQTASEPGEVYHKANGVSFHLQVDPRQSLTQKS